MPLKNSYIWYSKPSDQFLSELRGLIASPVFTDIPHFNRETGSPMHLTLALAAGTTESYPAELIASYTEHTIQSNENFGKSILLLPTDVFVTEKGFICVEYGLCPLENQGDIFSMHNALLDMAKRLHLTPERHYSRLNYRPHLTVGRLPYQMPDSVEYINANKSKILNALSNIRLLNVFNITLEHFTRYEETLKLVEKSFQRRDYGVVRVLPHESNPTKSIIICDTEDNARKCLTFLYQFGKVTDTAALNSCEPVKHIPYKLGAVQGVFEMNNEQIALMSGIVNNISARSTKLI